MEPRPKVVVFDLGKVLLDFDFEIFARRLAGEADVEADEVMKRVVHSDVLIDYEYGRTTSDAFYQTVRDLTGYRGDYAAFEACFGDIFTEIPEMILLNRSLREASIPTFIFSNTNEIAIQLIRAQYPFFSEFSGYILSYEHGLMKPDGPLYEIVEKVTKASGSELVFMDDKAENIAAARERGWHGIVHESVVGTRARLRDLGLTVRG